jgi:hypothetical protein
MKHENVTYNHLIGYKYDILFEKMCNSFLRSKLSKILPSNRDNFKKFMVAFSKTDPLGFRYIEKSYKSVLSIGTEKLIQKVKIFIHKNRPRVSRKKKKSKKNKTRKKI